MPPEENFADQLKEFLMAVQSLREPVAQFIKNLQELYKPYAILFQELERGYRKTQLVEKAGWIPHYTTPFHLIDVNNADLRSQIDEYYKDNWNHVRSRIEQNTAHFDLDHETRSVLLEALNAHEQGFYRSVCRLIFPELERLSREKFYGEESFARVTSQEDLQKLAENMPLHSMANSNGIFHPILYNILTKHVFAYINNNDDVAKLPAPYVPNRHATIHGKIIYKTAQNSMNSIFIMEFVLYLFDYVKKLQENKSTDSIIQTQVALPEVTQ